MERVQLKFRSGSEGTEPGFHFGYEEWNPTGTGWQKSGTRCKQHLKKRKRAGIGSLSG